ncbi:MAG TPA: hypothetical protein VGB07_29370 [Blastocatellia bacterium]
MTSKLRFALAVCLFCLAQSAIAYAQQPAAAPATSPEVQLLRAMLEEQRALREEVRQLRATIQRTNINTYRAQRLAEQFAQQQNRVDGFVEQIEQVKTQIQQSLDTSRDEEELRELEAAARNADPQTRQQLVQTYESLKRSIERQRDYARQEAERNRARQQQLEATLQAEQSRLAELREQLDALDRDFDRQVSDDKKGK